VWGSTRALIVADRSAAEMPVDVPWRYADGEGGPLHLGVGRHHQRQVEVLDPLGGEGHADQPRGVGEEEGDLLGRDRIGGHDQVAFVLAVLVVHYDDDLTAPDRPDGILHR
jgi:hypothetical protein